jgi:hypothetical protein
MRAHKIFGSLKLFLVLTLLVGGVSASAITFADSIFIPFGNEAWSRVSFELFTSNTQPAMPTASVTTDKHDYRPGETVIITATGFWPNEQVRFEVDHITAGAKGSVQSEIADHQGHDPWYMMADSAGNVNTSWLVQEDSLNQTLLLTADQAATSEHPAIHAETTFTDSSIGLYDQCSNDDGDGYSTGDTGCRWTNGNLQRNNSTYSEGEATVQRLWLTGLTAGATHTLTLKYGTTKQGKHAYDYLTTWDHSENWISDADLCQDMDANANSPGGSCTLWGPDDLFQIPEDPNPAFDAEDPPVIQPADRFFTMRNGNITAASTPTVVSGSYAGDSETVITITFTVLNDADACPTNTNCSIALWFGAHIAMTDEWASGGATTVPGSPYHVALDAIDGDAIGQRDNQMQAGAIVLPAAQLTIVKEAIPEDPASPNFEFDPSANLNGNVNFFLDDDGAGGSEACTGGNCLEQRTFTALPAGVYSVAEINIPSGWDLTNSVCSDGSPVNNIVLDSGENVICTFTNTKRGNIIVDKVTLPAGDAQSFSFDASGGTSPAYVDFNLTDAAAPNNQQLKPGAYSVSETVPAGWDLTNTSCVSSIGDTEAAGALELDAGETITCTFTNTKRGNIIVDKVTNPSGDTQSFAFDAGGGTDPAYIDFNLTDAAAPNNQQLKPGAYTVAETVPAGWDLTNTSCVSSIGDTESAAALELDAGETITCTFTNTKRGRIIVDKVTNPSGDPQSFAFDASGGSDPAYVDFNLTDAAAPNNQQLKPGAYSVSETVPAGWDLFSTVCVSSIGDTEAAGALELDAGETITCTFTNRKRANIIVDKVTIPAGDPQSFAFDASGGTSPAYVDFNLTDAAAPNNQQLQPGAYSVSETVPSGWDLTNTSCVSSIGDTESAGALELDAGETITCTFTNTKRGRIIVDKVTNPSGDPQSFAFDASGGTSPAYVAFNLTDAAAPNNQQLKPGAYSVSETVPSGWDLTNTSCVSSIGDTEAAGALELDAGETITCTFTNTKRGNIIVDKVTVPAADPQSFAFDASGGTSPAYVDFNLTDAAAPNNQQLKAGAYSVSETVPAGWDLTNTSCVSSIGDTESAGALELDAGETITCTFTNTKRGNIIVDKVTNPAADPQSFAFDASGGTSPAYVDFNLTDVAAPNNQQLKPGTYSVSETVPAGWDLTSATCSDGSPVGAISLQAGETITCTFTNTKRGKILVDKVTVPAGSSQLFEFDPSYGANFFLDDNDPVNDSGFLVPGSYSVAEVNIPAGWVLTDSTCSDGSSPANIGLAAGETVTCTFTNKQKPTLIVRKVIEGESETFSFVVAGTPAPPTTNIDLTPPADGEASSASQTIDPGNYSVTETPIPDGWLLTDASCVSDQGEFITDNEGLPIVTFTARYGDDIICSFFDNQQGGATRTQGFWQTHTELTNAIWNGTPLPPGTSGITPVPVVGSPDEYLCLPPTIIPPFPGSPILATPASGQNQVMGGFWASIPRKTTGQKRVGLDQARMQMLQQYFAAVLNVHAFGTPIGTTTLANARAVYCADDISAINAQKSLLAAYNEEGDDGEFTPGVNASAKLAREQANIVFWNMTFR